MGRWVDEFVVRREESKLLEATVVHLGHVQKGQDRINEKMNKKME